MTTERKKTIKKKGRTKRPKRPSPDPDRPKYRIDGYADAAKAALGNPTPANINVALQALHQITQDNHHQA